MTRQQVILTGHIIVPPERIGEIRTALDEHIRLTHAEPGCIRFEVTEDSTVPGRFDVSEAFTDQAAFDAHQDRTRKSDWGRISAGLARHYTVTGPKA
jgi:quinol monooxygenase YgiN